jgi:hypothetical protein
MTKAAFEKIAAGLREAVEVLNSAGLSEYELRVLRQMATGGDEDLICGAAMWVTLERLARLGAVSFPGSDGTDLIYTITDAGRALVRERDAELTEANNGHR